MSVKWQHVVRAMPESMSMANVLAGTPASVQLLRELLAKQPIVSAPVGVKDFPLPVLFRRAFSLSNYSATDAGH